MLNTSKFRLSERRSANTLGGVLRRTVPTKGVTGWTVSGTITAVGPELLYSYTASSTGKLIFVEQTPRQA